MDPKAQESFQNRLKITKNQDLEGSGGPWGEVWEPWWPPGEPRSSKMSENHVRGPPPGSPFGHHFGTENDKMHEKVVPDEGLGRNRRVKRKKAEKWSHPGRADMQSDCACAVETRFSGLRKRWPNASKMTSKMGPRGTFLSILGTF